MRCVVELLDVQSVAFKFDDCAFVVVDVAVVGCGEDGDDHGELLGPIPLVHLVPIELGFVRTNDRQQLILVQELVRRLLPKEKRTPSDIILDESLRAVAFVVFDGV